MSVPFPLHALAGQKTKFRDWSGIGFLDAVFPGLVLAEAVEALETLVSNAHAGTKFFHRCQYVRIFDENICVLMCTSPYGPTCAP